MERKDLLTEKNYRWIYTYDYALESVWEEWRSEAGNTGWIEEEAEAVLKRTRPGLKSYILLTDSHFAFNGTWDDTVSSMKELCSGTDISGIIHLGDMTDGLLPLDRTLEIEGRVLSDMESLGVPLFLVPGNHDYNYFKGNPELRYPERLRFYSDLNDEKIRFIFIDSFDPKESVRYGFPGYCIHWLDDTLKNMPEGFSAVIFSHLTPLVRLQAWTDNIRNRAGLIEVLDRHAEKIICYINGHNHCDQLFNDLKNGQFPLISINCAKCEYFTEHKPEGSEVPVRRLGDRTQESFDIMQVDGSRKEIYFTRFGAGRDRMVKDHRAEWL